MTLSPLLFTSPLALGPPGERSPEPTVRELNLAEWASEVLGWGRTQEGMKPLVAPLLWAPSVYRNVNSRGAAITLLGGTPASLPSHTHIQLSRGNSGGHLGTTMSTRGTLGPPRVLWPGRFVLFWVLPGLLVDTPGLFLGPLVQWFLWDTHALRAFKLVGPFSIFDSLVLWAAWKGHLAKKLLAIWGNEVREKLPEILLGVRTFSNGVLNQFFSGDDLTSFIRSDLKGQLLGLVSKKLSYITTKATIDLRKTPPLK